jgi:DNA repair photolyase
MLCYYNGMDKKTLLNAAKIGVSQYYKALQEMTQDELRAFSRFTGDLSMTVDKIYGARQHQEYKRQQIEEQTRG